jgi:hypothetical protein
VGTLLGTIGWLGGQDTRHPAPIGQPSDQKYQIAPSLSSVGIASGKTGPFVKMQWKMPIPTHQATLSTESVLSEESTVDGIC